MGNFWNEHPDMSQEDYADFLKKMLGTTREDGQRAAELSAALVPLDADPLVLIGVAIRALAEVEIKTGIPADLTAAIVASEINNRKAEGFGYSRPEPPTEA